MSNPTAFVQKLWNYCNILSDDGLFDFPIYRKIHALKVSEVR